MVSSAVQGEEQYLPPVVLRNFSGVLSVQLVSLRLSVYVSYYF